MTETMHSRVFDRHGLKWHKLPMRARFAIIDELHKAKRAVYESNLKAAGAAPDIVFATLNDFDIRGKSTDYIFEGLSNPDVACRVLKSSLQLAGMTEKDADAAVGDMCIEPIEFTHLYADICNIELASRPSGNPDTDPVYEQPPEKHVAFGQ